MPATMAQTVSADLAHTYCMPNTTRQSGVYRIENTSNGHYYIGSTCDLRRRERDHFRDLRRGAHFNPRLQRAWSECGESVFRFVIADRLPPDQIAARECELLAASHGRPECYNVAADARHPTRGRSLSPEHVAKVAAANRGRRHSDETRANMRAGAARRVRTPEEIAKATEILRNAPRPSPETLCGRRHSDRTRAKMSEAQKERWRSLDARTEHSDACAASWSTAVDRSSRVARLREAYRTWVQTPEAREHLSARMRGRSPSAETRQKQSEATRGRKRTPEQIERTRQGHIGKKRSAETCAKISAKAKGRKMKEEHRLAMIARLKGRPQKKRPTTETIDKQRAARLAWWERKRQETA